jgi:hypothetical protein
VFNNTRIHTEHDTTTSQKNLVTNFIGRFTQSQSRSRKVAPTEEQVRQILTETNTPVPTFNENDEQKLYRHIVHLFYLINSVFDDKKYIKTYQREDHIELLKKFFILLLNICKLERIEKAFNESYEIKQIKKYILLLSQNKAKDFVSNGRLLSQKEDADFVSFKLYLYNEIERVNSLDSFQLNVGHVKTIIGLLNSVFDKLRDVYIDHTYHYVPTPLSYDYPDHVPISLGVKSKAPY